MSQNKRILYLSYDGMTDPLGQSQVLPYLIHISKRGYDITLISFEKEEAYQANKNDIEHLTSNTGIQWTPLSYHKRPPIISTLYDVFSLKKKIKALQQKGPFQIVHTRGYITALAGVWMKKKWGTRFLFDMRGFFADERVDGQIWNRENPIFNAVYKYFKRKEQTFFLTADHVVSLTEEGKKIILALPYIQSSFKCTVIPCCADLDHFSTNSIQSNTAKQFVETYQLDAYSSRWFYLGSIGTWYMLPEMLDFFKIVLTHEPNAVLTFFTYDNANQIQKIANEKGISDQSIIITPLARKDIPSIVSLFDASIFFIKPVFSKKASSPTKQGEIMAMGIPIVCNDGVGDTGFIINKYQAGIAISSFNKPSYEVAYTSIKQKYYNKEACIKGAHEWFSLALGVNRYDEIYKSLLEK